LRPVRLGRDYLNLPWFPHRVVAKCCLFGYLYHFVIAFLGETVFYIFCLSKAKIQHQLENDSREKGFYGERSSIYKRYTFIHQLILSIVKCKVQNDQESAALWRRDLYAAERRIDL
jgi:hypothetical protein